VLSALVAALSLAEVLSELLLHDTNATLPKMSIRVNIFFILK
jgi:hypothetical protein